MATTLNMPSTSRRGSQLSLSNPLQSDPQLQSLLSQLDSIKAPQQQVQFDRWQESFLERLEHFLEQDGIAKATATDQWVLEAMQGFNKTLARVQACVDQGLLAPGQNKVGVKAQTAVSRLKEGCVDLEQRLLKMMPGSNTEIKACGYDKFQMGAVLVRDGFQVYGHIMKQTNHLQTLKKEVLESGVVDRQILDAVEYYQRQIKTLCDVMADLGLMNVMIKTRVFAGDETIEEDTKAMELNCRESFASSISKLELDETESETNSSVSSDDENDASTRRAENKLKLQQESDQLAEVDRQIKEEEARLLREERDLRNADEMLAAAAQEDAEMRKKLEAMRIKEEERRKKADADRLARKEKREQEAAKKAAKAEAKKRASMLAQKALEEKAAKEKEDQEEKERRQKLEALRIKEEERRKKADAERQAKKEQNAKKSELEALVQEARAAKAANEKKKKADRMSIKEARLSKVAALKGEEAKAKGDVPTRSASLPNAKAAMAAAEAATKAADAAGDRMKRASSSPSLEQLKKETNKAPAKSKQPTPSPQPKKTSTPQQQQQQPPSPQPKSNNDDQANPPPAQPSQKPPQQAPKPQEPTSKDTPNKKNDSPPKQPEPAPAETKSPPPRKSSSPKPSKRASTKTQTPPEPADHGNNESDYIIFFDPSTESVGRLSRAKCLELGLISLAKDVKGAEYVEQAEREPEKRVSLFKRMFKKWMPTAK